LSYPARWDEDAEAVRERFGGEGWPLLASARDNDTGTVDGVDLILQRDSLSGNVEIPLCSRFDPGPLTPKRRATGPDSILEITSVSRRKSCYIQHQLKSS